MRTIRLMLLVLLVHVPAWAQEELTVTKIYSPSGTDLTLSPAGKDVLPDLGYDVNLGMLTKKYLTLHAAELWVETLVAQNTIATIGGRVLVGPTTTFVVDVGTGDTTIHVKHNQMVSGDRVYAEADSKVEFFAITSAASSHSGHFDYTVTRNLDGSGANLWTAGDALFNTGTTGNGFIDLYSVRGVRSGTEIGPTIVGNVRVSATYNDWSPRWAVGNLDGLYGYSGSTYGAAFGVPNGARVTVDSTNGIRIYGGDNDQKVTIDTSGNATFDGSVTIGTGQNMVRNANCSVGTSDWNTATNTGLTVTLAGPWPASTGTWNLGGINNDCYISLAGTPGVGTVSQIFGGGTMAGASAFPVVAGQRYEASAYVGNHGGGNVEMYIQWLDGAGASNGFSSAGNACTTAHSGGTTLVGYCRTGVVATAPAGTGYGRLYLQMTHTATLNPFLFMVQAYFGEAGSVQEDLSPWVPGGQTSINNGLIETDAINARTIAADSITTSELAADSVTAAKIDVTSLSAISANLGTVTAGSISGVTATFGGGGEVSLNSSGIQITAGTGDANRIDWSDGGYVVGNSDVMFVGADSLVELAIGNGSVYALGLSSSGVFAEQGIGDIDLGSTSALFDDLFVRKIRATTLGGTGSTSFVCTDNDGDFYAQSTTCDGSAPAPAPALAALWAEIAALREQVAQLESALRSRQ